METEVKAIKRSRRSPEKIVELVMEADRTGNASVICRREGISPQLFYRWKNQFKVAAIQGMKDLGKRGRKPVESSESREMRVEIAELKEALVRSSIELGLLKKSVSSR
jgi:transposase-like protein